MQILLLIIIIIIITTINTMKYIYIAQIRRKNAADALKFTVAYQTEKFSAYNHDTPSK